jgi:heavy metal translocating P-type ATPase
VSGNSSVDESALTGEPVPRAVGPGDELMSGSVCLDGALEVRALRPSGQSQYERIVQLVGAAQAEKAPIGRLADRYAVAFTPLTLAVAAAAYAITGDVAAVLAVLVVATPCPLILATPVAVLSGINRAARRGVVVKSGAAIEQIGRARAVVFDKTGTLTTGSPVVARVVSLDGVPPDEALRLAAGLEQLSSHPMARALVSAGRSRGASLPTPEELTEVPGQGVAGRVEGHRVEVGSPTFAIRRGLVSSRALAPHLAGLDGAASALIGVDGRAAALAVFDDPPRPGLRSLMAELRSLGVREIALLTGDDEPTARRVAAQTGIATVRANLLPGDKVAVVRAMLPRYGTVVMVGDGINDAPALAAATVGVALGARGAAVSAEAADVVIATDDLGRIAEAIWIGRRTRAIATQSIWVGMGASTVLMVVAALGYIPPTLGALLQEAIDVAVILNALRR